MEIKVPDLGVDSAEVSEIMVNVGDTIAVDDNLVLLESDKASVEVPATTAGTITAISVNVGDKVKQGDVIVTVESAGDSEPTAQTPDTQTSDTQTLSESVTERTENTADTPKQIPQETPNDAAQTSSVQTSPTQATPATEQTFALPDLGVETAEVSEWLVKVGDNVTAEQPLVLVESDKASVEVPAPVSGTIVKLLVNAGDNVRNGQDFVVISGQAAASQPVQNQNPAQSPAQVQAPVTEPKTAAEPAQPKQTQSQPTETPVTTNAVSNTQLSESQINAKHVDVHAGPAVRKLTRQLGVDISDVKGTGAHGRIVKEDIFAYVKNRMQSVAAAPSASASTAAPMRSGLPPLPDMSKTDIWGDIETQDLSRLQKVSIPQLNYNTYLPQVTQFDLSDITDTEKMRGELKDEMKKQGISLTILAFIMKATAYALMQHPKFNSHLSDDNTQIIIRKTVHMGFAVATPTGLTVPVIKDVQTKGIKQIATEIGEMAAKARDNKLTPKDLTGASFTISSQGNLGGTYFTPLVTWPQVAILGVSEASMQPRWNEATQSFEPRLMLPLSLSYDHRVINGADAAVFTRYIAKLLADPRRILL